MEVYWPDKIQYSLIYYKKLAIPFKTPRKPKAFYFQGLWNGIARTASKVPKYGVFSGPYFLAFSPNAGKYGSEKTPYLDSFHAVPNTSLHISLLNPFMGINSW